MDGEVRPSLVELILVEFNKEIALCECVELLRIWYLHRACLEL
jgi:hypothetical protein